MSSAGDAGLLERFERGLRLLEETVEHCVGSPRGALSEDAYLERVHLAQQVFSALDRASETFLAVARGEAPGALAGHKGALEPLSFPRRFLNTQATSNLDPGRRSATEEVIQTTFLLGLMTHLVIWQLPTRIHGDRVDLVALEHEWLVKALVADLRMKALWRHGEFPTIDLFEAHYRRIVEPLLKGPIGIGLWGRAKAHGYFRNVFCAGWLLGMMYDLQTEDRS